MGIIHRLSISIGDLDSRDVNLSRVFEAINEMIGKPMWKGYVWRHIPCILNVVHVTKWRIFEVLCDACSKVHDVIVKWCLKTSNILYFSSKKLQFTDFTPLVILHIALNIFFRWRICAKLNLIEPQVVQFYVGRQVRQVICRFQSRNSILRKITRLVGRYMVETLKDRFLGRTRYT